MDALIRSIGDLFTSQPPADARDRERNPRLAPYAHRAYILPVRETKSQRVHLRVAQSDDELFRNAAAATHESLSEFLVESGRERAERVLADRTRFALSPADWQAFTAALDRPARELPAVVELFRRPRPE